MLDAARRVMGTIGTGLGTFWWCANTMNLATDCTRSARNSRTAGTLATPGAQCVSVCVCVCACVSEWHENRRWKGRLK